MLNNISHIKWDTFKRTITIKDANDVAIDITWSTIILSIKEKVSDTAYILQSTATLTTPASWIADISISAATMVFALWNYYYDIEWTDVWWNVVTILKGNFTLVYDITT